MNLVTRERRLCSLLRQAKRGTFYRAFGSTRDWSQANLARRLLLPVVLLFACADLSAQVIPALRQPPDIGIYGDFTLAQPSIGSDAATIHGLTAGVYYRSHSIVGIDTRGVLLAWGGYDHEYSALFGPRVSLHFGRVSPYAVLEVGAGLPWRRLNPDNPADHRTAHSMGFQWAVIGGMDLYLRHHWSLRAGEISFSDDYASGQIRKPINYSFGLVYRLR